MYIQLTLYFITNKWDLGMIVLNYVYITIISVKPASYVLSKIKKKKKIDSHSEKLTICIIYYFIQV